MSAGLAGYGQRPGPMLQARAASERAPERCKADGSAGCVLPGCCLVWGRAGPFAGFGVLALAPGSDWRPRCPARVAHAPGELPAAVPAGGL